jgi:hypothetical protein
MRANARAQGEHSFLLTLLWGVLLTQLWGMLQHVAFAREIDPMCRRSAIACCS